MNRTYHEHKRTFWNGAAACLNYHSFDQIYISPTNLLLAYCHVPFWKKGSLALRSCSKKISGGSKVTGEAIATKGLTEVTAPTGKKNSLRVAVQWGLLHEHKEQAGKLQNIKNSCCVSPSVSPLNSRVCMKTVSECISFSHLEAWLQSCISPHVSILSLKKKVYPEACRYPGEPQN